MEENNQNLNNMGVETPTPEVPAETPVVDTPVTPVEEAPVEATPVEAAPAEVPVEVTPEAAPVEEAPVEATPVEAPVEAAPEVAMPTEVPAMEQVQAEVAPVEEAAPSMETPAMNVNPVPVEEAVTEAPDLPVVDPAPAVAEMPEAPAVAETVDSPVETVTPEAMPTDTAAVPDDAANPPAEEKKSKAGVIILVIVLLLAIAAAVYFFLIKGKEEPTPEPTPSTPSTKAETKYLKHIGTSEDGVNYESEIILNADGTFLNYVLDANGDIYVLAGTYQESDTEYVFNIANKFVNDTCSTPETVTNRIAKNADGTLTQEDGNGFETVEEAAITHINEINNTKNISCNAEPVDQPEENNTVEENTTTEDNSTKTVEVESVTLDKESNELIVGKNFTLKATVKPKDATDQKITWETSDKSVATVKDGKVTAVKAGSAIITAKTSNGKEAKCSVTVKEEQKSDEEKWADAHPNCTYGYAVIQDGSDGKDPSGKYTKFKSKLETEVEDVGAAAANSCKTLAEIIDEVKKAAREKAAVCWTDEMVTKTVESAACKLTPGCDKKSQYGNEAVFNESKKDLIIKFWKEPANNCSKTEDDYHL